MEQYRPRRHYYDFYVCPQKSRKPGSYYLKVMMLLTPCPYLEFLPEVSSSAATNQAKGELNWVWSARNFLYISRLINTLTHLQANTQLALAQGNIYVAASSSMCTILKSREA